MKDFWGKFKDFSGYPTNFQFSRTFQGRGKPRFPLPPPPTFPSQESVPLAHTLCLTNHEWPLPCGAKIKDEHWGMENIKHLTTGLKGNS